jgi:hypothetical protein
MCTLHMKVPYMNTIEHAVLQLERTRRHAVVTQFAITMIYFYSTS